jgi:hypothetical protein
MKKLLLLIIIILLSLGLFACKDKEPEYYTVYFRGNGGSPIIQTEQVAYGEPLPDEFDNVYLPTRNGYEFMGYYYTLYPVIGSPLCPFKSTTYDVRGDTTCYANWRRY